MVKFHDDVVKVGLTLDRIEGDYAILSHEKDTIEIPKHLLPKGLKEGDTVVLSLASEESDRRVQEKKARELLNEILGVTSSLDRK